MDLLYYMEYTDLNCLNRIYLIKIKLQHHELNGRYGLLGFQKNCQLSIITCQLKLSSRYPTPAPLLA
jgi:hypothetical protein